MTESIQARLAERVHERERIARELHDTLLQGFHGLTLRFQKAVDLIPQTEPAHPVLSDALDRADSILSESRDRIRNLRYEAETIVPLPEALAALGEELMKGSSITFKAVVDGPSRELVPLVRDEIYFIGREALLNAFQHSDGRTVALDIEFRDSSLILRVRDDGKGLKTQTLEQKGAVGHWGLSGMHERASNIGAELSIWNRTGLGLEVELMVPETFAYKRATDLSRWQRARARLMSMFGG